MTCKSCFVMSRSILSWYPLPPGLDELRPTRVEKCVSQGHSTGSWVRIAVLSDLKTGRGKIYIIKIIMITCPWVIWIKQLSCELYFPAQVYFSPQESGREILPRSSISPCSRWSFVLWMGWKYLNFFFTVTSRPLVVRYFFYILFFP